ncbi:MAG: hypothetical protein ACHP7P_11570 [Terriglobales bacterium]
MKKRGKEKSKPRAAVPPSSVRVIRITEEAWAAQCGLLTKRGQPLEPEEFFDRALQLGSRTKAS